MPPVSTWGVVVAAGSGARYGGAKQLAPLGGRRVLDWALAAAQASCDGIVLVVAEEHQVDLDVVRARDGRPIHAVTGGTSRSASVRSGLAAVPRDADIVVVHDAARPLATAALFADVIAAVRDGADAAVPAVPVVDTLREVDGGTVDRARYVAVQTPQAFRANALRAAHDGAPEAPDDASLVEAMGGKVVLVPGDPANRKITTPVDLVIAEAILANGAP